MTTADIAGATDALFRSLGLAEVREIGRGATCTVYVAHQTDLLRTVAVKHFTRPIGDDKHQRRFERECQTLAGLRHPNILTLYSNGLDGGGRPYILMEYCPGGSLADALSRHGPMAVPDVARIGVKLCSALQLAHDRGVLHRDIKPANVLLTELGEPMLADFGIAGDPGELSMTVGDSLTPLYAAPEVLEDGGGSSASDVWSLASTLYALLLGRAPYAATGTTGEGFLALLERIVRDPVPVLQRSDVPRDLEQTLQAGMEKDPRVRVATARDFAMRLQAAQYASGMPVTEYLEAGATRAQSSQVETTGLSETITPPPVVVLTERKGSESESDATSGYLPPGSIFPPEPPGLPSTHPSATANPRRERVSYLRPRMLALTGVGLLAVGAVTAAVIASHHKDHPAVFSGAKTVDVTPTGTLAASCTGLVCRVDVSGITPPAGAQFQWQVGSLFSTSTSATNLEVKVPRLPGPGSYPIVLTETNAGTTILTARGQITIQSIRRSISLTAASTHLLTARARSTAKSCERSVLGTLQIHRSGTWKDDRSVRLSPTSTRLKITRSGRYRIRVRATSAHNAVCLAATSAPLTIALPAPAPTYVAPPAATSSSGTSSQPRTPVSPDQQSTSKPKNPVHP